MRRVALLFVVAACAVPHPPPAPPRQTNLALDMSRLELSNGLRVVVVHDPRATEVEVTMRYRTGSVDDPAGQEGVAHLVEHLMYQQVLGAQSLFAHLQDATTYFNGMTTYDATTYVARARPERLDELLSIEAVRVGLRCTSITDAVFAREREVVVNELRQRGVGSQIQEAIHRALYQGAHPYRRPTGGSEDSVRALTRPQACAFADAHYTPANAVLVVSGPVTAELVGASLGKFLAHVAKRDAVPPVELPPAASSGRKIEVVAPTEDEVLVIAWPLPADPLIRARVRAVMFAVETAVNDEIAGYVVRRELGDDRAPMIGLAVVPGEGESFDDVIAGVRRGVDAAPGTFTRHGPLAQLGFDTVQQQAIYRLFATLEAGGDRDIELARAVLAGRDPSTALADEFRGLREMTRSSAADVARAYLAYDQSTLVALRPANATSHGHHVDLATPVHDIGQRRDPPDPAAAHAPAAGDRAAVPAELATRTLPNGLHVVLLPITSVPTVDVRLVFDAGTADELAGKRGAAIVAGHALTWDFQYLNDLLALAAASGDGSGLAHVELDHTTFEVRGLDMHLDYLLAGLRRWVREGRYPRGDSIAAAVRRARKQVSDDAGLTDAWRAARFGAQHPYLEAGLVRLASTTLDRDDAIRFRAAHFTPDNATLVIAGHFDAALANRWIDFLFADWTGHAAPRSSPPAHPHVASIARDEDRGQVTLQVSLPANTGSRASQLVAAAMLDDVAGDVRHQLGASYGLSAKLVESRLASEYLLAGRIDAARTRDAVQLLHDRLDALRADPDAAARAFVTARARVLVHLGSVDQSAAELAERVEHDVEMDRAPLSDVLTAAGVQALTIDAMPAVLAELDLSRATILMRGPAAALDPAFAALGRTPTYVPTDRAPVRDHEPRTYDTDDDVPNSIDDAITAQDAAVGPIGLLIAPAFLTGSFLDHDALGLAVAGDLVHRFDGNNAAGLHASVGVATGSYTTGLLTPVDHRMTAVPIDIAGMAQASALDRLWGGVFMGLHVDIVSDDGMSTAPLGLCLGAAGGVDLLRRDGYRLGLYGEFQSEILADFSTTLFQVGVAYRR